MSEQPKSGIFWSHALLGAFALSPTYLAQFVVTTYNRREFEVADYALAVLMWAGGAVVMGYAGKMSDETGKLLQISLSTAILLMVTAALLLWLNLRNRSGWPFDARISVKHYWTAGKEVFEHVDELGSLSVSADTVIAYFVLFAVGALSEWRLRRRERRP
ncbi:MAG TPA: hypothetical protein VGP72_22910 [Planctomycetota bacterium]|jgi:nitrate/nitrite transporter NarK